MNFTYFYVATQNTKRRHIHVNSREKTEQMSRRIERAHTYLQYKWEMANSHAQCTGTHSHRQKKSDFPIDK